MSSVRKNKTISEKVHKVDHEPTHKHMSEEKLNSVERRGNCKVGTVTPRALFRVISGPCNQHTA